MRPRKEVAVAAPKIANRAIGYYRVSTDEQSVAPQVEAVQSQVAYKQWELVAEFTDQGISGSKEYRVELDKALAMLKNDEADILAVAKLDRLSRSAHHFLTLMRQAKEEGWDIAIKELDLDTSTPIGKAVLTILAAVAELEVEMIRARTKAGLASKRSQGIVGGRKGVDGEIAARIHRLRQSGLTLTAIAKQLNAEGVVPAQARRKDGTIKEGAKWHPSSVSSVLSTAAA